MPPGMEKLVRIDRQTWKPIWLCVFVLVALASACDQCRTEKEQRHRSLAEARDIVLSLFRELDGFELVKQAEVEVSGFQAVRMEGRWNQEEHSRRGVIFLVDGPGLFNVIHYTAPSANNLFDVGYGVFEKVIKGLKPAPYTEKLEVVQEGDQKRIRSSDLQLEIYYPADWVYTLDEDNRAVVISGPKDKPTWLTTINFSVIRKWGV